jgi:predicted Fe-S protein YdhL (DUF1289 family)
MKYWNFFISFTYLLIAAGFCAVVMVLWNWLMPAIFKLATIDFWQAAGLLALSRIFFGSFRFEKYNAPRQRIHRRRKQEAFKKWAGMTDEQRQDFLRRRHQHGFDRHSNRFFGRDFSDMENPQKQ